MQLVDDPFEMVGRSIRRARIVSALPWLCVLAVLICAATQVLIEVLPPGKWLDPVSQPLSRYALLNDGWLFDAGVLVLATGLAALLVALVLRGYLHRTSPAFAALVVSGLGLIGVVVFPDYDASATFALGGWLHGTAAVLTFTGVPAAGFLLYRRQLARHGPSRLMRYAGWLSVLAGAWCTALFAACLLKRFSAGPLGQIGGVVERGVAATDLAIAMLLALWAWRARGEAVCRSALPAA
jgi:hypothetical membrane protein